MFVICRVNVATCIVYNYVVFESLVWGRCSAVLLFILHCGWAPGFKLLSGATRVALVERSFFPLLKPCPHLCMWDMVTARCDFVLVLLRLRLERDTPPEVMSGVNCDPSLPVGPCFIRRQCRQSFDIRVLWAILPLASQGGGPTWTPAGYSRYHNRQ